MLITLIETNFRDTIVITSDEEDAAAVNRAVVTELQRLFGDQLGAEEGPWLLAEHPYPGI